MVYTSNKVIVVTSGLSLRTDVFSRFGSNMNTDQSKIVQTFYY